MKNTCNGGSYYSSGAFLLGEVYNLESPQIPFSYAKRVCVMKCLGENETSAGKYTARKEYLKNGVDGSGIN